MGKSKKTGKTANANVAPAIEPEPAPWVVTEQADESKITPDYGHEDMEPDHGDVNDDTSEPDAPKAKKIPTWLEAQVERMKRAFGHNLLNAQIVRANAGAAQLSQADANRIADDIVDHAKAANALVDDFLKALPAEYIGIVPTRSGEARGSIAGARKGMLPGTRVKLSEKASKSFAAFFTPEQLSSLTLVSASKGQACLETSTHERIVISAKQVEALDEAA